MKYEGLLEDDEPADILTVPWFVREHTERVIDPSTCSPRDRKWVFISTAPDPLGDGRIVFQAGWFWDNSEELERFMRFAKHIVAAQNDGSKGVMPKARNPNREASGRFGRKPVEDLTETP